MFARRYHTLVLGAGSSGSVLARRLSARGDIDVLLIEAGPDYPPAEAADATLAEWPADLRDAHRNSMRAHDWAMRHRPHPDVPLYPFPRGRVVGGSSAVNTAIALRGQPYDFDEWGLLQWSWEHCLPAFMRLERDLDFGDAPYHGSDGPIPIRRYRDEELSAWQFAFFDACRALGFAYCEDSNAPGAVGYGSHAKNEIDGVRQNVAHCYLTAAVRARDTLTIQPGTTVRRVLFEGRRAVGVEVERRGEVERIGAERIFVCAGAIHTPGILVRSGVGPTEQVARLAVDLVAEVPAVGEALLDHPGAAVFLAPTREGIANQDVAVIQTVLRFQQRRGGRPADLQMQPGSFVPLPGFEAPLVSMMVQVGKPRGRGRLRFDSPRPDARPWIDSRLLAHPDDLDAAVEAMELVHLLVTEPGMQELARLVLPTERGFASRAAIKSWILNQTGSGYHPCGTVPMGSPAARDPLRQRGATDAEGRVHGTENLVVADASLLPTVPSSNINLPTIMLAERLAELHGGVVPD